MLIKAENATLIVIDVQERLIPVMAEPRLVIRNCALLLAAAQRLAVPALATEQYSKGIGPTVPDLRPWLPPDTVHEKLHFSAAEDPALRAALAAAARPQVVLAGIEAHVCVLQTALGLRALGFEVFVATDACSSRTAANARAAFDRMRQNGIECVTTEMVVFEWLHAAGTPAFKDLVELIK